MLYHGTRKTIFATSSLNGVLYVHKSLCLEALFSKVKVGNEQEVAQLERNSHSKNRGGKKLNQQSGTYTKKIYCKPNGHPFSQ